jgi:hypothetical protein
MRAKDIVYVVLKFFPFFLIVKGVDSVDKGVMSWYYYVVRISSVLDAASTAARLYFKALILFYFLSAAFLFGVAIYTWMRTVKIQNTIFPPAAEQEKDKNPQPAAKELQTAAFFIIGIFIFAQAGSQLLQMIGALIKRAAGTETVYAGWEVGVLTITGILISLMVGIALIKWARPFSAFICNLNRGAVTLTRRLQVMSKRRIS